MKKSVFLLAVLFGLLSSSSLLAQSNQTDSFKVYGNCGMCKKRIEKSLAAEGIARAEWNVATKMMTVTYDPARITNEAIQKKIAAVGHDTDKFSADAQVYDKLPGCCLYDRKKAAKQDDHSGHKH
ncbi:heavy-metal-associated domain-containing protein [Paraflavitalea speifideaquila]|uniref:heavy-metal-associated domain-containing protein n=1 Tax=Paraflavitalea speifideaquila TaxID=3076558 RepID=UPI0028E87FF1|nr:heavy-metal-associated domain-containing protein [Paraflavitalea speifideiaquila]